MSLSALGIEVRGRSTRLTVSYRTTQEILAWSVRMLAGRPATGLDDLDDTLAGYHSPVHGRRPVVRAFADRRAELDGITAIVGEWLAGGVEPHAIGVVARTGARVREIREALTRSGISVGPAAVRVGTMHSTKGMEFRCVLVASVDAGSVPAGAAVTPIDQDPIAHEQDVQRERCLLFVACTRARDLLTLTHAGAPSPFLGRPADTRNCRCSSVASRAENTSRGRADWTHCSTKIRNGKRFCGAWRRSSRPLPPMRARWSTMPSCSTPQRAIYGAFGDMEASGGLTRAQLSHACRHVTDESSFQSRFDLFCRLGMLLPHFDKLHQQRYVFNPTSAAGILVFDRLAERGGVDELVTLLDRTRADLASGAATAQAVRASLRQAQRMMTISADHLLRMVSSSPLSELVAQRGHHRHASLMDDVFELTEQVRDAFPELDAEAYRLVVETQRYVGAREQFVGRLLDEGAAARDFSLLDPEEYLEAARTASIEELAEVFATTVFDPPDPWLDPAVVADGVLRFRPRTSTRRRPPRPADPATGPDPMDRVEERAEAARTRRARAAELHLQGATETDLTSRLRAAGWPAAATMLVELIGAHADPDLPFEIEMSDELLVEPEAPVTYLTPVSLRRMAPASPVTDEVHRDGAVDVQQ